MSDENKETKDDDFKEFPQKYFIEFVAEGLISATEEEVDEIHRKISDLLSQISSEKNASRINIQVTKFSEEEFMFSLAQQYYDPTEH
jgi:hypothetical protein